MSMTAWIMVTMMTITNTHVSYGASTIYFEMGIKPTFPNYLLNRTSTFVYPCQSSIGRIIFWTLL
jgi:hypothetical protein